MCGIVGLFAKNAELQSQLGMHLERMLVTMSDRGPDSAGLAIYGTTGVFLSPSMVAGRATACLAPPVQPISAGL